MIVEVCANSLQSAVNAQRAGADRIELCAELAVGGITPSYGMLSRVREVLTIPVHVLIRPRSGDFTYSDGEYEIMCKDIMQCKSMGFDGVVAGILLDNMEPDLERTRGLHSLSGNMHFTFHRAFDWIPRPMEALKALEDLGIDTILSSGQAGSAINGISLLRDLHHKAGRLTMMPGSGIRASNAGHFKEAGFRAVHLSAIALKDHLKISPPISMNSPGLISDIRVAVSQEDEIRAVIESVK